MTANPNLAFNEKAIRPVECLKEAWQLIKNDYWLLFGISLVGALLAGATMYVLFGAMICGIFGCYLKKIDGGEVRFEDLWLGMKYLVPSIPVVILFVVPIFVYMFVIFVTLYGPMIAAVIVGEKGDPTIVFATFGIAIVVDIIVAIAMTIIHSFIIFAFPLMVDRGLGGMDAIKLSARAVTKNMGGIGGVILLNFGIVLLGQLAFCIGIYFTIPILTASNLVAYRKVFPKLNNTMPVPPALFGER
jgi:hypothetical protein